MAFGFQRAVLALFMITLFLGCLGGGCQNDAQCKPGESCVKGACLKNCVRELEWCDSASDCCPGMECNLNACRFPVYAGEEKNTTPGLEPGSGDNGSMQNNTALPLNGTFNSTGPLNESANQTLLDFDPKTIDLAEGQSGSVGSITLKALEISESLIGCSVENESALIRASGIGKNETFLLRPGEEAGFLNAMINAIDVPCTVTENETYCSADNISAKLEVGKKYSSEASLEIGQRFFLPDGESYIQAKEITELGGLSEYYRAFSLSKGEELSVSYPYLGGVSRLDLKLEDVTDFFNLSASPAGKQCQITSKRAKLKVKISGIPESYVSASEGENTTFQWHRIKIEKISESLFPSDGSFCSQANTTVLLNISFPKSYRDLRVKMDLYQGDSVQEIAASGASPWESDARGLMLEVSPTGEEATGNKAGVFKLRALYSKQETAEISPGENFESEGTLVFLESLPTRTMELSGRCILLGGSALVQASEGGKGARKSLSVGEAYGLGGGGWVKLLGINYRMSRNIYSCRVTLERVLLSVSQTNRTE
ncbi:MAG: hypothetical protein V1909_04110 [Candidatus Micrarchaeota archaeon]